MVYVCVQLSVDVADLFGAAHRRIIFPIGICPLVVQCLALSKDSLTFEDGTQVVSKRRSQTTLRRVITQNTE